MPPKGKNLEKYNTIDFEFHWKCPNCNFVYVLKGDRTCPNCKWDWDGLENQDFWQQDDVFENYVVKTVEIKTIV